MPGMAIAIVEDDKVTLAKGFGVRALGSPAAVDADTIFPTGSTGKAFTVAALGILVDQGKIAWDDKVIDRLPGFQMYDPWVTREMTIRDLLVHRSGLGLGSGDLLFVPRTNLSRAESVRRLRYIKPATSFRSGFAYDNILYMVAGQLIEAVSGSTWEKFTAERVLKPAGMLHSTSDDEARFATADRAQPHARMNGGFRGIGDQARLNERDDLGHNAAPAGGLAISANDMARWLMIQLDDGKLPGGNGRLFSEAAHAEMWQPMVLQPITPRPDDLKLTQPMFNTYALGWDVRDYRGAKIVWHGGAVFGFLAAVVLIPEKHVGFSILINSEDGEIINGLLFELLDHYLGFPANDWPAKFRALKQQRMGDALKAYQYGRRQSGQDRTVAVARSLRGNLRGPLVRQHPNCTGGGKAHHRFQIDAAHGRHTRTLAIRQLHHALRRQNHRAGVRDLRPRCRRQGRARHHEAGITRRRLQLRLSGFVVHADRNVEMTQAPSGQGSWFQRYLLPGLAFKAVVIGGGYATGRELAEFFMPSGPQGGLLAMLVAMLIWSAVCAVTFCLARVNASWDYRTFFKNLLGRGWVIFEAAYVLFMILVLAVFGAAAGAIGAAVLGWPPLVGTLCLIAGIIIFSAYGNASVERLFKWVSIFLYGIYAIFVGLSLFRFGDRIAAIWPSPCR